MRVISQNGEIDIPYERFSFSLVSGKYKDVEYACIYCHNLSLPHGTKMAEYTSKKKALMAMDLLRTQYKTFIETTRSKGIYALFQFPYDERV